MKAHSTVDNMTNSSDTTFISVSLETYPESFNKVEEFLRDLFKNGDSMEDFEISVLHNDIILKSKKTKEVFSLDNVFQSFFCIEGAEY